MADEKIFQSRIQLKHDIEENWLKAINFIPKEGEIIIYDVDDNNPTPRFKVGNGETVVNALPFVAAQADWNITDENNSGYIKNKPDYDKIVADVEELSSQVAYIGEFNEDIMDAETGEALLTSDIVQETGNSATKVMSQNAVTNAINRIKGINSFEDLNSEIDAGHKNISLSSDADITVSQTLALPAGTTLIGNGATIRRAIGFEGVMFSMRAGCRIENLIIEGNCMEMVSPTWDKTIEISTRANCIIDGVIINNANEGIIVYEDDVLVRGCKLYNCGGNGIHFSGANRTRVEDCVIIGANKKASQMGHSEGCIIWSNQCCDTVVSNCWCEDGIAGFGAIDHNLNSNIKLIGNTVKGCTQAILGRFTHSAPNDIQIIGNHFIDSSKIYIAVSSSSGKYPYTEGFVISDNICENTRIEIGGVRGVLISGNTVRGDYISVDECPYSVISNNVVDHPTGIGIHTKGSSGVSISGNNVRCQSIGVYGSECVGILIFGNILRQSPHNSNTDCIKLNSCPEAAIDNNKLFVYYGCGITATSNCRTMGNYVVVADSSQTAIRVYGGHSGYVVAQNMSNGTYSIATATGAVIQNNITITSTAFVDVTYTLTNLTADGFTKALTEDDFEFTLTAVSEYSLPDTIAVTMGGTALTAGTGYAYDKLTGKVTVYRVNGALEITAG